MNISLRKAHPSLYCALRATSGGKKSGCKRRGATGCIVVKGSTQGDRPDEDHNQSPPNFEGWRKKYHDHPRNHASYQSSSKTVNEDSSKMKKDKIPDTSEVNLKKLKLGVFESGNLIIYETQLLCIS